MTKLRSILLWAVWLYLTLVFLATLKAEGWPGLFRGVLFAADVAILFFAEGFEVSVIDLSDKDCGPLGDSITGKHLREVQVSLQCCLANRQIFVALAITAATLLTTFPALNMPFEGTTTSSSALALFPLSYVTLTVLWFSQVAPKLLAATDPEEFFALSQWLWPTVKAMSRLGLPDPGAQVALLMGRYLRSHHTSTPLPPRIKIYFHCETGRWVITWRSENTKRPTLSVKHKVRP